MTDARSAIRACTTARAALVASLALAVIAYDTRPVALAASGSYQTDPRAAVHAWLSSYDDNREAEARRQLEGLTTFGPFASQLMVHGKTWIAAVPDGQRDRRRLLAAAAALDVLNAGLAADWRAVTPLVEWGCGLVRQVPSGTRAEKLWQLSAIALMGGGQSLSLLGRAERGHLAEHVLPRVGDDPRLRLAAATMARLNGPFIEGFGPRDFSAPTQKDWYSVRVGEARAQYRRLFADPLVGEEARVRDLDYLFAIRDGRALQTALDEARQTVHDSHLRYVVLFVSGQFHDLQGRSADAVPYYREANALVPTGRSAALALSAWLYTADQPTEAQAVLTAAIRSHERDPWHLFRLHDFRFYPEWRRDLSEAISR